MNKTDLRALDDQLERYVYELFNGLGRVERRVSMRWYVAGLLLDGDRKSMQPMAARLVDTPDDAEAMRQRLQGAVVSADWQDGDVRSRLAMIVAKRIPGMEMLVVDDTGFPKKGTKSPGVARQYSGTMGRVDNCQVAVSVHLAGVSGSACLAMRLYLPESWVKDEVRRAGAHIPEGVVFRKKWEIALDEIDNAMSWGVTQRIVGADAGYGEIVEFRHGLTERGLQYVVRVPSTTVVWRPGEGPIPPSELPKSRLGRPRTKYVDGDTSPVSVGDLARELGALGASPVTWAEGTKGLRTSMFGSVRIRTAHRHAAGLAPGAEEWMLYEWIDGDEPRVWLATVPADTPVADLVRLAKLRWRIERDYQEMKNECGLDHYEGRTWRGFHHHMTLCMVAHAFLAIQRALFPPAGQALDVADGESPPAGRLAASDRHLRRMRPPHAADDAGLVEASQAYARLSHTEAIR